MNAARPVRILIVDDSATSRLALRLLLGTDPDIVIVGEAKDGKAALTAVPELRPDLVLMDVSMPVMDGIEATTRLMAEHPLPIVLISDLVGRDGQLNFKALQAGALDILGKPAGDLDAEARGRFTRVIRMFAEIPVVRRRDKPEPRLPVVPEPRSPVMNAGQRGIDLVCIGASTGGPMALLSILQSLGGGLPWPVAVVQHVTPGFTEGLVKWLADATRLPAQIISADTTPRAGVIYFAPDHRHLVLQGGRLQCLEAPPVRFLRPSIDVLFRSVAASPIAPRTAGVLLTGMGADGAEGLLQIRRAGGWTAAQDEASSIVYGMPKAAVELDAACEVLPIGSIGPRLLMLGESRG